MFPMQSADKANFLQRTDIRNKSCPLKVHPSCYPTFANRYDNKLTKPTDQELRDFVCEDCVNGVDG